MDIEMEPSWKQALQAEFSKEYFSHLLSFVEKEYSEYAIFPEKEDIFKAFSLTPFDRVKVVILGQDPYHGEGQAVGLSFSVPEGTTLPPSLRNIYKELASDIGEAPYTDGDLTRWAEQGVLLLNATLTVRAGAAGSHQKKGWEEFTDAAIRAVSDKREHVVFILWGNYARAKRSLIDDSKHLIIESAHPSPLSASNGFFGSRPFSKANEYLEKTHQKSINWV